MLTEINCKVLSYCEIPEDIAQENSSINEASCDSYIQYNVTSKEDQAEYDDNFDLDDWIIENYPEVEGKIIMIHVDY